MRDADEPIRLVLLDEDQARGLALLSALRRVIPNLVDVVIPPRPQARPLAPRVIDVLLVNLEERPGESLAEAIFHCSSRPWLAPLFCFDEQTASPELDVVLDLGVGRVLPIQTLRRLLTRALVPLGVYGAAVLACGGSRAANAKNRAFALLTVALRKRCASAHMHHAMLEKSSCSFGR